MRPAKRNSSEERIETRSNFDVDTQQVGRVVLEGFAKTLPLGQEESCEKKKKQRRDS